jgi:iron complex outermembrane receptor protein
MSTKQYFYGVLAGAILTVVGNPASAQTTLANPANENRAAQSSDLQEIVVTAARREQLLQDAPAAINVVSGATMEDLHVVNVGGLTNLVPGLKIDGNSNDELRLGLRGAFASSGSPGAGQAVGLYIDGVPYGHTTNLANGLFDIQRVEVLRGPQGTLYGQNVIGGLISIMTKDPGNQPDVDVKASYSSFNRVDLHGYVAGPLADTLSGSLSFNTTHSSGWLRNLATANMLDQLNTTDVRAKLLWHPTDKLVVKLVQDYSTDTTYGLPRQIAYGSSSRFTVPNRDDTYLVDDGGRLQSYAANTALLVDYDLAWATFSSVSSYQHNRPQVIDQALITDPAAQANVTRKTSNDTYTQEFRLSGAPKSLHWQVGTFILNDDVKQYQVYNVLAAPGTFAALLQPTSYVNNQDFFVRTKSYSIFAEATYDVTNVFGVTVGGRYNWDHKDSTFYNFGQVNKYLGLLAKAPFNVDQSADWTEFTPKVTVDAKWSDLGPLNNLLLYATYSKGYEAGDFFSGATVAGSTGTVPPEVAKNYETGFKTTFWDHKATFNTTAFLTDYTALQTLSLTSSGAVGIASTNATAWGIEVSATLRPISQLTLTAEYAYLNTRIASGAFAADGSPVGGNQLPESPPNSYDFAASYVTTIAAGTDLRLTAAYTNKGPVFFDVRNSQISPFPSLVALTKQQNIDAEIALLRGHWELAVFGTNLTNNRSLQRGNGEATFFDLTPAEFFAGGSVFDGVFRDPRSVGVSVRWSY